MQLVNFVLFLVCFGSILDQTFTQDDILCESPLISSCKQCIATNPECAWCSSNSTDDIQMKRCRRYSDFKQTGTCENLDYPKSEVILVSDVPLSSANNSSNRTVVQLQPQQIRVKIRNGETKKFNVTFRKVTDYPVDLYYLMDLSFSMNDDLVILKGLGQQLADKIRKNVTQDIQMGFGTFVDKVLLPFASTVPDLLKNPCQNNEEGQNNDCAPPFDFRHQQSMSANLQSFRESVNATKISGNIDTPEGMFDALMQIAVCGDTIGWRNDSSRLVVITTDAPFHLALDGKLASILDANDMECHLSLENATSDEYLYNKSKVLDYPSIGQLRVAFGRNKIQPIFAVTKDVQPLYEELQSLIPNSYVDQLEADSSNIITIIQTAYNQLRGRLDMTLNDEIPPEIDLSYRTLCPESSAWSSSLSCDQIQIGSEVIYEFEVKATGCTNQNPQAPLLLTSSSLQEDVKIYFDFACSCNCSNNIELDSENCNSNGDFSCGVCACDPGFEGQQCQCEREQAGVSLLEKCKMSNKSEICESNGQCVCGECICNEDFFKDYCECSRIGCPANNFGICGGADRGTCENCDGSGTCVCQNNWFLDSIDTCSCNHELCMLNNETCSGRGNCSCHTCECHNPLEYSGTYCETCINPSCKSQPRGCYVSNRQKCAECVTEAQRNREKFEIVCQKSCEDTNYEVVSSIPDCETCNDRSCLSICNRIDRQILPPEDCSSADENSFCGVTYKVVWSQNDYYLLIKEFDYETDCPKNDPKWIIIGVGGGVLLIGIISLAIWKLYQTIRDRREYLNFEKSTNESKWTKDQNPIFEKPSTRFENPLYQGND